MKNNLRPASVVAMVRPAAFCFNEQTAVNNFFQQNSDTDLQQKALAEFDAMVSLLRHNGIKVLVLQDTAEPVKPDAVFPNNWFSCMDSRISIFPIHAKNRRTEKRQELVDRLQAETGIFDVADLSSFEHRNIFLEGTGSMVIDHRNRIIYACISVRTNEFLLKQFAQENKYRIVSFASADEEGREIYHTNVMMCIGDQFAVVCTDAIGTAQRENVIAKLITGDHEIVQISFAQMNSFAGNMLELTNDQHENLLVMSRTAFNSLSSEQIKTLEQYSRIITPDVSTIEKAAGGSVRCMMAELFTGA